jgi:hypothetical protein
MVGCVVRFLLLAAIAGGAASCAPAPPPDGFPSVTLDNGTIKARVFLPDADRGFYRGPRFDWSGMVGPVTFAKVSFFAPFRVPQDPLGNDDGIGPAEEFGMDAALAYADTPAGGTFIKIGVGELTRPSDPSYREYHFFKPFKIATMPLWKIAHGRDWIEFHQVLRDPRGWGYDYVKRIQLAPGKPVLIVEHRLTNIGSKIIDTTWYCHNLINIDAQPIGPAYAVDFPFAPVFTPPGKPTDIRTHGNRLTFVRPLPHSYGIYADVSAAGGAALAAAATVWNSDVYAGVRITSAAPLVKYHFYAERTAVCPEMFIRIHLEPGQTQTWESRYLFISGSASLSED